MQTILIVFHLFLAVGLIGLILIQHGKGADMGAAFGSGASGTVFGAKGSASFLTRLTAGLATLFFITSMVMAYFATQREEGSDLLKTLQKPAVEEQAQQPQSDIPPVPGSVSEGSEMPPVPVSGAAAAPAEPVPAQGEVPSQAEAAPQPEAVSQQESAVPQPESVPQQESAASQPENAAPGSSVQPESQAGEAPQTGTAPTGTKE